MCIINSITSQGKEHFMPHKTLYWAQLREGNVLTFAIFCKDIRDECFSFIVTS